MEGVRGIVGCGLYAMFKTPINEDINVMVDHVVH